MKSHFFTCRCFYKSKSVLGWDDNRVYFDSYIKAYGFLLSTPMTMLFYDFRQSYLLPLPLAYLDENSVIRFLGTAISLLTRFGRDLLSNVYPGQYFVLNGDLFRYYYGRYIHLKSGRPRALQPFFSVQTFPNWVSETWPLFEPYISKHLTSKNKK